jgi:hypothetical protein
MKLVCLSLCELNQTNYPKFYALSFCQPSPWGGQLTECMSTFQITVVLVVLLLLDITAVLMCEHSLQK